MSRLSCFFFSLLFSHTLITYSQQQLLSWRFPTFYTLMVSYSLFLSTLSSLSGWIFSLFFFCFFLSSFPFLWFCAAENISFVKFLAVIKEIPQIRSSWENLISMRMSCIYSSFMLDAQNSFFLFFRLYFINLPCSLNVFSIIVRMEQSNGFNKSHNLLFLLAGNQCIAFATIQSLVNGVCIQF